MAFVPAQPETLRRIVVLADSLALPRREPPDLVTWDETWPRRLQQRLDSEGARIEVVNCGQRNRTVDTLLGDDFEEHVRLKEPDVVILQVGICDCAPRLFSRRERSLLRLRGIPPFLRQWVIRRRSRHRRAIIARNPLSRVYTHPERFAELVEQFLDMLKECSPAPRCIVLPIVANCEQLEQTSPGYTANVQLYNGLLAARCAAAGATWLAPEQLFAAGNQGDDGGLPGDHQRTEYFCSDGYHLSPAGNHRLSKTLTTVLRALTVNKQFKQE